MPSRPLVPSARLLLAGLVALLVGLVPAFALVGSASSSAATSLCGFKTGSSTVTKTMVIWFENHSYGSVMGSASAPYMTSVANQCGLAKSYTALTHPSLPNYLSATSGQSYASSPWSSDCAPTGSCTTKNASIFSQLESAGKSWRGYAEGMTSNCAKGNSGNYLVRHNPPAYYSNLTKCAQWDLPMGTTTSGNLKTAVTGGTLPTYSSVTPNACNDMHNCGVSTGDTWLKKWLPVITAGPDYQSGKLAVFVVFDEGSGSGNSTSPVYCSVLSAFTKPGTVSSTAFNHYSLLRTSEEIGGVPVLGLAGYGASMRSAFGL